MIEPDGPTHLLDADVIIAGLRGEPLARARLVDARPGSLAISTLTEAELLLGVEKRRGQGRRSDWTAETTARFKVLPWSSEAAAMYAKVRSELEAAGKPLARIDLSVAAQAMAIGATLVSGDAAFRQVPRLKLIDWRA